MNQAFIKLFAHVQVFVSACVRQGVTLGDLIRLSQGDVLTTLLPVIRGYGEVQVVKHTIDMQKQPGHCENTRVVESHYCPPARKSFVWDPEEIILCPYGAGEGRAPCNVNLMEELLNNQQIIPEDWKTDENGDTQFVFFPGTQFEYSRDKNRRRFVYYMYWTPSGWVSNTHYLDVNSFKGAVQACFKNA